QSKKNDIYYNKLSRFKICQGNQPTNSILIRKITPYNLGALIAMYEHKIFVQGYILNIFSFDQWGVEIGKKIAQNIYLNLSQNKNNNEYYDSSTTGLI
ncbi:MAG: glucose-6-phosphate isomerase, partial [Serratia symbiotica]|nr:glucose-6-phosphate isomerase [Serratia symbiotica]